jgi:serine/threonine protein kinase, bacterial
MSSPNLLNNRYRILSTLGDGGFGKTYLVEDTQMPSRRKCVLKQLKPIHDNPQIHQVVQERFQREAAILEQLGEHHTQIPRLYAYFSEGDEFYLVEEWIEGETLAQRGILREAEVRSLLLNLLPTIADIHQQGIVHRDIKPDNIILRRSDHKPVLIDFGAVKETMSTLLNSHGTSTRSIIVGTPGYMPSEQMAGRPVFSSDLYSLGLTAIYLLTGRHPQQFDTDPATGRILWRQYASHVSAEFAAILDRAIEMNPNHRFTSVQEMLSALNSSAGTLPPLTTNNLTVQLPAPSTQIEPPQPRSNWRWVLFGIGAASLVGVGVVAAQMLQQSNSPTPQAISNSPAASSPTPVASSPNSTASSPTPAASSPSPVASSPNPAASSPNSSIMPQPSSQTSPEPSPKSEPLTPTSQPSCNYAAGETVTRKELTVNTCSISTNQSGALSFVYYLDRDRVEAETDCSGTWISFPEKQVNRPQSPATQKMLDRVCSQKAFSGSTATARIAIVIDPPSNIRVSPNGTILCSVKQKQEINVYEAQGDWYATDICGTRGVIHSSQLRF